MMENQFHMNEEELQKLEKSHRRGKIMGGLLVIAAGSLFLARELGAQIPAWVFTWKVVLIALGLVIAVKHKFKHAFWFFMVLIGGVCLMADLYPNVQIKAFVWPSLLILLGIFIVFKPRNKHRQQHCRAKWQRRQRFRNKYETYPVLPGEESSDDRVEFTTFMGAVRKIVISKNFKSAEVTNVFGGTELNLMQADFEDKASMEITQVFGGTKLIVPANWEIKSEIVTVIGNMEDKRPASPKLGEGSGKVLVLTGTTVFGGIEISSY